MGTDARLYAKKAKQTLYIDRSYNLPTDEIGEGWKDGCITVGNLEPALREYIRSRRGMPDEPYEPHMYWLEIMLTWLMTLDMADVVFKLDEHDDDYYMLGKSHGGKYEEVDVDTLKNKNMEELKPSRLNEELKAASAAEVNNPIYTMTERNPTTDLMLVANKYLSDEVKEFELIPTAVKDWTITDTTNGGEGKMYRVAFLLQMATVVVKEINEDIIKEFCERVNHAARLGLIEKFRLSGVFSMELYAGSRYPKGTKLICFYVHSRHNEDHVVKSMPDLFVYEGELRNYYGFDPRDLIVKP